jgi:hypothetical protein
LLLVCETCSRTTLLAYMLLNNKKQTNGTRMIKNPTTNLKRKECLIVNALPRCHLEKVKAYIYSA